MAITLKVAYNRVQFKLLMDLFVQHGVSLTLTRWIAGVMGCRSAPGKNSGYAAWKLELCSSSAHSGPTTRITALISPLQCIIYQGPGRSEAKWTHQDASNTRELISAQQTSHKDSNKDLSCLRVYNYKPHQRYMYMYLWWSLCTLYLHACQVRVTVGNSSLCRCTCVTSMYLWQSLCTLYLHTWQVRLTTGDSGF